MRRARTLGAVAVGVTLTLSACSQQSGQNLARQACVHVNRSVRDFAASQVPGTSASLIAQLRSKADGELRAALPLAAQANSDDGSWNSLMTTLSEDATVDEAHLVPALKAQCALANANPNVNPQNVNPQNVNPQNVNPQNVNPQNVNPQNVNPEGSPGS